jgi:hypothetical protein
MSNTSPNALKAGVIVAVTVSLLACALFLFVPYLALDLKVVYGGF